MIEPPSDNRSLKIFSSLKDKRRLSIRNNRNDPYWVIQTKLPTEFKPHIEGIVPTENPYSYMGTLKSFDVGNLHRAFSTSQTIRVTGVQNRSKNNDIFSSLIKNNNDNNNDNHHNHNHNLHNDNFNHHHHFNCNCKCDNYNDDDDGTFLLKITKGGKLNRKIDMIDGKKKGNFIRHWKQYGVILSGSQLMFFKDVTQMNELESSEVCNQYYFLR